MNNTYLWRPAAALWHRDVVRFLRQRNRIISALVTPLVFWVLLGAGFSPSFRPAGGEAISYLTYFFPGTLVLILLFTAIFSTISVIEGRRWSSAFWLRSRASRFRSTFSPRWSHRFFWSASA